MKKLLIPLLLLSFSVANAQNKTKSAKKKEAQAYAKINKDRQAQMNTMRTEAMASDSMRFQEDSLNDANFDSTRMAWKMAKENQIDSINKDKYGNMAHNSEMASVYEHSEALIYKSAKLSDNQGHQVAYINNSYRAKAEILKNNPDLSPTDLSTQLTQLNAERSAKIKAALGKGDYRHYTKAEANFKKKNPGKTDVTWITIE